MTTFEFHIMMGLPGSGKTVFAQEEFSDLRKSLYYCGKAAVTYFDLDKYKDADTLEDALENAFIDNNITTSKRVNKIVIIDGLILTIDQLNTAINFCKEYVQKWNINKVEEFKFNIHYWNLDRFTCAQNDRLRVQYGKRSESAFNTITHAQYDNIDDFVYENTDVETYNIIKHDVYKASVYDVVIKPKSFKEDGSYIIESESWSLGGEWGDCWGNSGIIESENPHNRFEKFDELLTELCPNISYLNYRKVYDKCVYVHEDSEYGYYGSYEKKACYRCKVKKLYDTLVEMELI